MKKTAVCILIVFGLAAFSISFESGNRPGFAASSAIETQASAGPIFSCFKQEEKSPPDESVSQGTWASTYAPSNIPSPRSYHTAVWTGTEMIVWGGTPDLDGGDTGLNTGGRYDPVTDTWTLTSTGENVPSPRYSHTAVWTETEMIVWGGRYYNKIDHSYHSLNDGGRYNPATDSWTPTSTDVNVPSGRAWHTGVWTGTEMIIWGGYADSVTNTGGKYNPTSDTWTPISIAANVPSPRRFHTAVWTDSEMIIWGGHAASVTNTGGRYSPASDSWISTSTGANVPSERDRHTAIWTGSEMIVWGGANNLGSIVITGGRYNPTTNSWVPTGLDMNTPSARYSHTAVWTGSEMIIWGGAASMFEAGTGGRYDPGTDTWTPTGTSQNVLSQRQDHTAVWTGTEMIVWGGWGGEFWDMAFDNGGRYNPAIDTWSSTSTGENVPAPRCYHTAVWTGSEMIIWGGKNGSTRFNTGSRYDPISDSWTPTSTGLNVPSVMASHTAVWTGSEMIVWDGVGTDGRYNPATDTWTPTSTGANIPSGRIWHTAIWTGSEMIVWGGDSFPMNITGGRYDPATDIWTPTSTGANVPSARECHTTVWTGSEMIIWGGSNGVATRYNTGGRYDPVSDTWTPTSTGENVPSTRQYHTAVWTGSEMIVWGGQCGIPSCNTGGRYNPVSDTWTPTSTGANVPSGRASHTAVWTGNEMIIWGGDFYNTGGRYNPVSDNWTPTSTGANVPSKRELHTAVWTGSEMIIWGGVGAGIVCLNTGGRYKP